MGHSIAHIPMGYANRMGNHVWNDILIYTSGQNAFGEDVAAHHYNDYAADLLIALKEPWVFNQLYLSAINFVPFAIIDHSPVSSLIMSTLTPAFKVIAPSRFAQRELKTVNKESHYVPHGVRTDNYKPMDKTECRKQWFLEEDDFVVGIVAMNRVRKMIPRQIRVYKRFLENNPDVKSHLFLWTNMNPPSRPPEMTLGVADTGVNLIEEIMRLDLAGGKNDVRWMDPNDFARAEAVGGIPEVDPEGGWDMRKLYNCFDVLSELTGGEAVGLPKLEAQACGVPCVCTDYAGAPEYLGSGYTVPADDYVIISTPGVRRALVDIDKGAEALARIMNGDPARYARRARRFAERYSWENVMDGYMKPFLQEVEEELYPRFTKDGVVSWR